MAEDAIKTIAVNKKARHEYFVEDTYEAGIVLSGTEVKSIRAGKLNFKDCYATIDDAELFVHGMYIAPYEFGNIFNKDPERSRKLLVHKYEINKLIGLIQQKGFTLIPLKIYFKRGKVKVEVGVCRGKKLWDKREDIAKRDAKREIARKMKEFANR